MAILRTGNELRKILDAYLPFTKGGKLKPKKQLVTIVASNSTFPNDLFTRAMAQASAEDRGSPQIVQYSYTSVLMAGDDPGKTKSRLTWTSNRSPCGIGAESINAILSREAEACGADMLFLGLDHFVAPKLEDAPIANGPVGFNDQVAELRIHDAQSALKPILGRNVNLTDATAAKYVNYMVSPQYQKYRKDFLDAVKYGNPAWAMIDTGHLPLILNFATTRDILDAVRKELGNHDVILEAELSSTGKSGDRVGYVCWKGMKEEMRQTEIRLALNFIDYTNADAIAYDIGMKHAAKLKESFEPDIEKLIAIQEALYIDIGSYRKVGRHIPFVQHGGSGASEIPLGLVGKVNKSTAYQRAAAQADYGWCVAHATEIASGEKTAISEVRHLGTVDAMRVACVGFLKETQTYGIAPKCREILGKS